MRPGFAALRLGFLSRILWFKQASVWAEKLIDKDDVRPCLSEIDDALLALSSLLNNYQREVFLEIRERIAARHSGAAEVLGEILNEELKKDHDPTKALARLASRTLADECLMPWRQWQSEDWNSLRNLLTTVVQGSEPLSARFDLGDHSADVIHRICTQSIAVPLSEENLTYLYSGIARLTAYEQRQVRPLLGPYSENSLLLVEQIKDTFLSFCALLQDLPAIPVWNGSVLTYRKEEHKIKKQSNSVITHIINLFEAAKWRETITLQKDFEGDITQAIYQFNKTCKLIRLSRNGNSVSWSD